MIKRIACMVDRKENYKFDLGVKGLIKISYMLPNPTHLAKSNNQMTFLYYQTLKANHKFKIGCIVSQQEIKLKTS